MLQVLACGAAIVTLSMGIRHGFGLWLQPITMDRGWSRETFAFALAVQNLSWGLFGIFAGMLADRFGAFRVLVLGALLYALGLLGMALSTSSRWSISIRARANCGSETSAITSPVRTSRTTPAAATAR